MQTVRRLYVYLLSGVTLAMLASGLTIALNVLLSQLGLGGTFIGGGVSNREQLSLAAALVGVGLPVWAIHWFVAERGIRPSRPGAESERASTVRALYLTIVLAATLAFGVGAAVTLVRDVAQQLLGGGEQVGADRAGSLALLIVTGSVWGYHVAIRRRDLRGGPLQGAAAWLPRLYLYWAMLIGLVLMLQAIGGLVEDVVATALAEPAIVGSADFRRMTLGSHLADVIAWSAVWLGHLWYACRLVSGPGWRGAGERSSRLRVAYFIVVIGISAVSGILLVGEAARAVLVAVMGAVELAGGTGDRTLAAAVITPLLSAIPWAIAWWLHLGTLRSEALETDDEARAETAERLERHAVAITGLAFGAVGIGWLLGMALDALLGGNRSLAGSDFWRLELATYAPYAVLGAAVWAWKWAALQAQHRVAPSVEAGSMVRRTFLLITLAAALLSGLGSMALILYRAFGFVLGADLGGNAVSELSTPIGALLAAVAVAAYHGLALRRDDALRAAAAAKPLEAAEPVAEARRVLVLSGPAHADLDALLEGMRSSLPPGHRLDPG
jgi:hypothetical protein